MNKYCFTCFVVLLMLYVSSANYTPRKEDPPLKLLFQIVSHFKDVQSCGRSFTTKREASQDGVRKISYSAELKKNESPLDICKCIHDFLSQKSLVEGAIQSCCVRKNIVTMTIEGEPDPTIKETNNSKPKSPLEELEEIFAQFPKAEVENHQCRTSTRRDKLGNIYFKNQCDLRKDSPKKEELCAAILKYVNQGNWLGKLTYTCASNGKVLDMEIYGKLKK